MNAPNKAEALQRFTDRFGEEMTENLPYNQLPASFQILVRERSQVVQVAERFYDDPYGVRNRSMSRRCCRSRGNGLFRLTIGPTRVRLGC
jgi:cell division protein FtsX